MGKGEGWGVVVFFFIKEQWDKSLVSLVAKNSNGHLLHYSVHKRL